METRTKKQISYGLFFVLFWSVIGYGIFYYQTRPTCFDGVKNGKEEGVDCGGKCANVCRVILPLQTSVIKVIKIAEGDYDILVRITNPNNEYGSGDVEFGLGNINSTFYILPGQTKYIVLRSDTEITESELNIKNAEWEKLNFFNAQDVMFRADNQRFNGTEFEAFIFNDSDFDFDTVDVSIVLYDNDGNVLAVNRSSINTLISRTSRNFKVLWPTTISNMNSAEVQAHTNLFKNSNFIKRYGSQEKFQEYYPD